MFCLADGVHYLKIRMGLNECCVSGWEISKNNKKMCNKKSRIHEHMWMDINWKALVFFASLFFSRSHCNKNTFPGLPIRSFTIVIVFTTVCRISEYLFLRYILHFNGSCFYSLTHSIISYLFAVICFCQFFMLTFCDAIHMFWNSRDSRLGALETFFWRKRKWKFEWQWALVVSVSGGLSYFVLLIALKSIN